MAQAGGVRSRRLYACEVLYVTDSALGFDYMLDNLVIFTAARVGFDLIIIEEAETPLIVSSLDGEITLLHKKQPVEQRATAVVAQFIRLKCYGFIKGVHASLNRYWLFPNPHPPPSLLRTCFDRSIP